MKLQLKAALAGACLAGLAGSAGATETLRMATIAPGSSAYLVMTTMATLINQAQDDYQIQVDATGAATRHMIEVAEGELDMSMTSPNIYRFMREGGAMYQELPEAPELAEELRLMFWFPYGQYHYIVYADSDIESIEDLRGRSVFLGPPGGGAWNAAHEWVRGLTGMTAGEDYENVRGSWSSALQGFQDRQFDVFVNGGIAPFPQVDQLALTSQLRLLGLTEEEFEASEEAQALTSRLGAEIGIIPAGTYADGVVNAEDVYTHGASVGVTVRADLDEETVYLLTRTFWEQAEAATAEQPWLRNVSLEYAVREAGMQLHPGALRYYEEIGLDIPEGSR
ncbi:TAXI family TRAP transporter solute-binding subunit [Pararhodobacter sp. SW119]|uniref:TAXI family TRAP transporter solute-binding subunit n=1 Tax=Pararhodobacter sp. SW119 TaxID=2780075 RepID=UPI001ADF3EBB|nr:TAXI family TRAP transporter solute-binding subunit [Pararhodobacter sp. SW119]